MVCHGSVATGLLVFLSGGQYLSPGHENGTVCLDTAPLWHTPHTCAIYSRVWMVTRMCSRLVVYWKILETNSSYCARRILLLLFIVYFSRTLQTTCSYYLMRLRITSFACWDLLTQHRISYLKFSVCCRYVTLLTTYIRGGFHCTDFWWWCGGESDGSCRSHVLEGGNGCGTNGAFT